MSEKRDDGLMVIGTEQIGQAMTEMMKPMVEAFGNMFKTVMEQITVMSDRMDSLERQVRLSTPVDGRQVKYLSAAMKDKARNVLSRYELDADPLAVKAVVSAIKKSVLARYGIGTLREIPKCEYSVAMSQISLWSDAMVIRDVMKGAMDRADGQNVAGLP